MTTVRLRAEIRHQAALLVRDPGPMIGYVAMGILLITVTRPLYRDLGGGGIDQAAAGMSVMFSLFALKVAAAHLLNERTWHTWDRLRSTPAGFGEILLGKAIPIYGAILAQQVLLLGYAAAVFGLHPKAGWWALGLCILAWSACVLLMGLGASTLARSPAQLSAAGDVLALLTTVLGGAIVPVGILPEGFRHLAPASPGYWALSAYHVAMTGTAAELGRPLAMLALFGAIGVGAAALLGAAQAGSLRLQRRLL